MQQNYYFKHISPQLKQHYTIRGKQSQKKSSNKKIKIKHK